MKEALSHHRFDVVYDLNGREAVETKIVLDACPGAPLRAPCQHSLPVSLYPIPLLLCIYR